MELSTHQLDADVPFTSMPLTSESQAHVMTRVFMVVIGSCISTVIVIYIGYFIYRQRRRTEYSSIDKVTWNTIWTASPTASESQDVQTFFSSSSENEDSKGNYRSDGVAFYIGASSEEEHRSDRFIKKQYSPLRANNKYSNKMPIISV